MNEVILLFAAIVFGCVGDMTNAFTCQEAGIFANTDSNDCATFIVCDSNLAPSVQNCHGNSYFWPEGKGCFGQYDCASNSMPGNSDPCVGFQNQNIPDKYSADCSQYLSCYKYDYYINGGYVLVPHVFIKECPSGLAFKPSWGCVSDYQCTDYQCPTEGLFENPNDPNDCSTFVKCSKYYGNSGGSLLFADLHTCQPNTKFSPLSKKCDTFYNCDGINPYGGIDPCFDCNWANPFVPNPFDSDGISYIECQEATFDNERLVSILKKYCPADTFFSPLLGKCYNNYQINESCSKDPCSSGVGKYVDYQSGHCNSFFECRDESKTLELFEPTYEKRYCPPGTRYNPETSNCNRQYVCPTFPVNYCYPPILTTTTTSTTTSTTSTTT